MNFPQDSSTLFWELPESRRLEFKAERVDLKLGHAEAEHVPSKYRTSTEQVPDKLKLLDFCREGRTIKEMMSLLNLKHRETFLANYLHPLMKKNFITMTIPGLYRINQEARNKDML